MVQPGTMKRAHDAQRGRALPAAGGAALKQAIHVARARAGITSDMQLALQAHVHYDTFMNWYGDRTVPRPAELKKVADVLGISYGDLMGAYEGRDPEPQPLQDALRELVEAVRALVAESRLSRATQVESTEALLRAVAAVVPPDREPRETPGDNGREARAGTGQ
jgi:hypothetical protein